MSRSNYDKPFYVDVGTSIVAIRCASNHDIIAQYDYVWYPHTLKRAEDICDRMNREAEIGRPRRNCDVGTSDEQSERFKNFCRNHQFISVDSEDGFPPVYVCSNESCPLHGYYIVHGEDNCELAWAQMSYETEQKGESNGGK